VSAAAPHPRPATRSDRSLPAHGATIGGRLWLGVSVPLPTARPRNDPRQYDDLVDSWWDKRGAFAMLHWLAEARAALVPAATRPDSVLVDIGCGGGLLAPRVAAKGHRHLGVDLTASALSQAVEHGVTAVRADAAALPLRDECADVVCAGEILEHVADAPAVAVEACRVLRPGGTLVIDTIAATRLARLIAVELAERLPSAAPAGIHDPALFVDRRALLEACEAGGVRLTLRGLRPRWAELAAWVTRRRDSVTMVPMWTTAVLFQGWGTKAANGR
jgi:2-polyprenyl-6-hydroxyphenyl methylase/3-demethylubiquinone-9 3-methyltransferase